MDRHRDRAGFPAREERGGIVVARRAQHRDPRFVQVVGTVEQRSGESRRIRVELRIRPGPGPIDDGRPIAEGSHTRAEIVHCETPPSASASLPTRSKNYSANSTVPAAGRCKAIAALCSSAFVCRWRAQGCRRGGQRWHTRLHRPAPTARPAGPVVPPGKESDDVGARAPSPEEPLRVGGRTPRARPADDASRERRAAPRRGGQRDGHDCDDVSATMPTRPNR